MSKSLQVGFLNDFLVNSYGTVTECTWNPPSGWLQGNDGVTSHYKDTLVHNLQLIADRFCYVSENDLDIACGSRGNTFLSMVTTLFPSTVPPPKQQAWCLKAHYVLSMPLYIALSSRHNKHIWFRLLERKS